MFWGMENAFPWSKNPIFSRRAFGAAAVVTEQLNPIPVLIVILTLIVDLFAELLLNLRSNLFCYLILNSSFI